MGGYIKVVSNKWQSLRISRYLTEACNITTSSFNHIASPGHGLTHTHTHIDEAVGSTKNIQNNTLFHSWILYFKWFLLAREFSPSYKLLEGKQRVGFGGIIRDILIEYGIFGEKHSWRHERSRLNQNGINISVASNITDHFF